MAPELALKLIPILEAYLTFEEMRELSALFDVRIEALDDDQPRWLSVTREVTAALDRGNTRRLVDSLLELAEARNNDGVAHTSWERNDFHRSVSPVIREAQKLLATSAAPSEIAVSAGSPFSAKSMVRELVQSAQGNVFVVDPYVGVGTLDCLRGLGGAIRLLTGTQANSIEAGFDRAVKDFTAEGHDLQVRQVQQLHDRHLVFNDRCWLVGGSLKDAGKKPFNCIEITDQKATVIADLEAKWLVGKPYP